MIPSGREASSVARPGNASWAVLVVCVFFATFVWPALSDGRTGEGAVVVDSFRMALVDFGLFWSLAYDFGRVLEVIATFV